MIAAPPAVPSSAASIRRGIKAKYVAYLNTAPVRAAYGMRVPWVSLVIAGLLCLTVVGIPAAIGIIIARCIRYGISSKKHAAAVQMVARCQPITVYPLMVNTVLLKQQNAVAPGLVVGTFQDNIGHDYFVELVRLISDIAHSEPRTEAERLMVALFADEIFKKDRRRKLPLELTGGIEVYAFDLAINAGHLPTGKVESIIIPCLAEPGEQGTIFTIPWQMTPDPRDWIIMCGGSGV